MQRAQRQQQTRWLMAIGILLLLGWWSVRPANAQNVIDDDVTVVGSNYKLEDGDTINGDLTVLGGNVDIESGATINGDVTVFGGNVDIEDDVTINGDVTVFGGNVDIDEDATINGQRVAIGGNVKGDGGSSFSFDGLDITENVDVTFDRPSPLRRFGSRLGGAIFTAIGMGALALIGQLFFAQRVRNISEVLFDKPLQSGGVGLLTLAVYGVLSVVLALLLATICFAIASFAGYAFGILTIAAGWVAIGSRLGERLLSNRIDESELQPGITAGFGTALLTLILGLCYTLSAIIPGLIFPTVSVTVIGTAFGLGAVVLTRLGTYSEAALFAPSVAKATPTNNFEFEHEVQHDDN